MAKKKTSEKGDKKKTGTSVFGKYIFEIIILAFTFTLFINSISNGYNMDDELVTINHRLTSKGISAIPEIFSSPYYQDDMGYAYEYRPVVLASFAIEHQLFGDNPHVSHFFNVLLYTFCCLLLYRVLLNTSKLFTPVFSLLVTLLFAAFPAHTEVVCSIKNRDEILGLIFCLLSLLLVFKSLQKSRPLLLGLLPFVFALALMNKITFLPFAIIILMAVIFFTETGFLLITVISFLLAVPGFLLMQQEGFFLKVGITLAIPLSAWFFYYIVKIFNLGSNMFQWEPAWKEKFFSPLAVGLKANENEGYTFRSFGRLFSDALPSRGYFTFLSVVLPFLILAIYIWALYVGSYPLSIAAILLLLFISIGSKSAKGWWATMTLYVAIGALTSNAYSDRVLSIFSVNAIILTIIFGPLLSIRRFFIPSVVLFFVFISKAAFHFILYPGPMPLILNQIAGVTAFVIFYLTALAFIFNKPRVQQGLGVIFLIATLAFIRLNRIPTYVFDFAIIYALLFFIIKKNGWLYRKYFWFAATAVAILFMLGNPPVLDRVEVKNQINSYRNGLNNLDSHGKVSLIQFKQDRPINFVEQPVSMNDPWTIRAGTSMRALFHYFIKTIVPYPLSFYYGYKFIEPEKITNPVPVISVIIYLLLSAFFLYFLKYNRVMSFAIGIYLVSIVAFSNYFFAVPGIVADRFLLTASLGWCIVLTIGAFKIFRADIERSRFSLSAIPTGTKYVLATLFGVYVLITFSRNLEWKDSITLMRHDISYVQNSAQAHNLLALNLMKKSYEIQDPSTQIENRTEALGHFKKALDISPGFYNATYDIARVYSILGKPDSSVAYFKQALTLDSSNSNPALFIGQTLTGLGRFEESIPYLQFVMRKHPADYASYDKLSFAYFKLGDSQKSIAVNRAAIIAIPGQSAPYINIAHVYASLNENDSARATLQRALTLYPNDPAVKNMMGQIEKH